MSKCNCAELEQKLADLKSYTLHMHMTDEKNYDQWIEIVRKNDK